MSEVDEIMALWRLDSDEAWEEMMASMTPEEHVTHLRRIYEAMSKDPDSYPGITFEILEEMKASADKLEEACRAADAAKLISDAARARADQLAADYFASLPDEKGH